MKYKDTTAHRSKGDKVCNVALEMKQDVTWMGRRRGGGANIGKSTAIE